MKCSEAVRFDSISTPVGFVFVGVSERGVCDIAIGETSEQRYQARLRRWAACHRVVTRGRQLGGYSGGLATKRALLQLEGHTVSAGSGLVASS